jgi:hypothetical protein
VELDEVLAATFSLMSPHNLLRWVAALGLGARQELVVAKTMRRTLLNLPGRLTRSARRLILHLPDPVEHTRSSPLRVVNATSWP